MPGDLQISILLAASTLIFTLVPPFSDLPVRIPLGLAMVLFIPGYTLIAALFPKRDDLDGIERVALSFGLSIATVPLIGLGLNYTPWGIRLAPIAISLAIFTIAMSLIAYFRRSSLPEGDRFSVGFRRGVHALKQEVMAENASRLDRALTVVLIISILASVTALAYVIVMPKQGEKFTEFYILGPKGKAYDYPTQVELGNSSTVIVGVVNHEYSRVNYTMQLEFYNATILQRNLTLEHNATWERTVNYTLAHPGDEQKLEFFLYKENNFTAPYRDLHLWVNVSGNGEEEQEENLTSGSKTSESQARRTLLRAGEGDGNKKRKSSQAATYNRTDTGEESKKIPSHEEIKFSLDRIQNRLDSLTQEPETSIKEPKTALVSGDTVPQAAPETAQGSSGAEETESVQAQDQSHQPAEEASSISSAAEEEEKSGSEAKAEKTRAESTKAESGTGGSSSSEEKASTTTTKAEESTDREESPSEASQASEDTSAQASAQSSGQPEVQSPKAPDKPSTSSISTPRKPVTLGSGAKKMVDLG